MLALQMCGAYGVRPLPYWNSGLDACRSSIPAEIQGDSSLFTLLYVPGFSLFYTSLCGAGDLYSHLLCMTTSYFEIRRL